MVTLVVATLAILLPTVVTATSTAAAAPVAASPAAAPASGPVRVCADAKPGHADCLALRRPDVPGHRGLLAAATPAGYGPADLASAYRLPKGNGATVAIVDAYDNPTVEADLGVYRQQYGLPACTSANGCFRKVDQRGGSKYPAGNSQWGAEISLDVDMVSAACPQCHILLVEADDDGGNTLGVAVDEAVALGAKYVSNSYGVIENPAGAAVRVHYDHPGVVITASSGDSGYGVQQPASFNTVTAVGGTSLVRDQSARGWTETAWSGAGSGCSALEPKPAWQQDAGCAKRAVADVSAVADPMTGVAVYDSFGSGGWAVYGGTSVSAPFIASVYALAGVPTSGSNPASYPYQRPSNLFDVTAGSNGNCGNYLCTAGPGYDGPTGLGTPNGVAAFSNGPHGRITGTITDAATHKPVSGVQVQTTDSGNQVTVRTDATGGYELDLSPGSFDITASGYGYLPATVHATVTDGQSSTQNIALTTAPLTTVSGTVTDGGGHGWPLYAKVSVTPYRGGPVFTDPVTGRWSITLPDSGGYTVTSTPVSPGYHAATRTITLPADAGKPVDTAATLDGCTAPGYTGNPCQPTPGGLLVGTVTATRSGQGLVGASVTGPHTAPVTTTASLGTGAQPDGFFTLFTLDTGDQSFTASKAQYGTQQQHATIRANGVSRLDFTLRWAQLSVTATGLNPSGALGDKTTGQLTVTNNGDRPATVSVAQRGYLDESQPAPSRPRAAVTTGARPDGSHPATTGTRPAARAATAAPWVNGPSLPEGLMDSSAAAIDGTVYSVGGQEFPADWEIPLDVPYLYALNTTSNSWTQLASMNFSRQKPAVAVINDKIYASGGWHDWYVEDQSTEIAAGLEIYDPHTGTWQLTAGPPKAYAASAGVALAGQYYVIGGCDTNSCASSDVYRYDPPTNRWQQLASYPVPAGWLSCGAIDGKIICAGGSDDKDNADLRQTYAYDPKTNTWSARAPMPVSHWGASYTVSNGLLLISGGWAEGAVTDSGLAYDPAVDQWFALPATGQPSLRGGSACGLYQVGGASYGNSVLTPISQVLQLPGQADCGATTNLPWLHVDRRPVTVQPGQSVTVNVSVDAGAVAAPGTFRAELSLVADTPTRVDPLPVTLTVAPSPNYGQVSGTVTAQGRCGTTDGPVAGETVTVGNYGRAVTVQTDATGRFTAWVNPSLGPVVVVAARPGLTKDVGFAWPAPGTTSAVNLTQRRIAACATTNSPQLALTARAGKSTSDTLVLGNDGVADYRATVSSTDQIMPALPASRQDVVPTGFAPRLTAPAGPLPDTPAWSAAAGYPGQGYAYGRGTTCSATPGIIYTFEHDREYAYDVAANRWQELTPRPQGLYLDHGYTVCDVNVIHWFGGYNPYGHTSAHLTYNVTTGVWSTEAPIPQLSTNDHPGAAAVYGGKIYVVLENGHEFGYDPATNTWSHVLSTAPVPVYGEGYAQQGKYLYLAGGQSGYKGPTAAVQRLDLSTGTWSRGVDLPQASRDGGLTATNAALYYLGGSTSNQNSGPGLTAARRLPLAGFSTGTWTSLPDLPAGTSGNTVACTTNYGGEIWTISGGDSGKPVTTNAFHRTPGESCDNGTGPVSWLSLGSTTAWVGPGGEHRVRVTVDTTGLAPGTYQATILVRTTDAGAPEIRVPVTVTVLPSQSAVQAR